MNHWRISIVFCGGCNPQINRGEIAAQVQNALQENGYQVGYNSLDVDFVIYLSGCSAGCALKYNQSKLPAVVVAAKTMDAMAIDEAKMVTEIVKKVRDYFE